MDREKLKAKRKCAHASSALLLSTIYQNRRTGGIQSTQTLKWIFQNYLAINSGREVILDILLLSM